MLSTKKVKHYKGDHWNIAIHRHAYPETAADTFPFIDFSMQVIDVFLHFSSLFRINIYEFLHQVISIIIYPNTWPAQLLSSDCNSFGNLW